MQDNAIRYEYVSELIHFSEDESEHSNSVHTVTNS